MRTRAIAEAAAVVGGVNSTLIITLPREPRAPLLRDVPSRSDIFGPALP